MFAALVSRISRAFVVIIGVACLVFLLLHLVPGDPVDVMLGESATPADRSALRANLGLDLPVYQQLATFLERLAHLDLGRSIHTGQAVTTVLSERLPATIDLAVTALLVSLMIAVPLGIMAAIRRDSVWDQAAMGISLLGVSIPNFWMGPILILVFSVGLGWLPVSGNEGPGALVLPAITLGTAMAAIMSRMIRSSLLEVLGQPFMQTARAKGLSRGRAIVRHGLRNAMLPVLTLLGLQLGTLLGGAVITEAVFSWPGIGQLTVEAIQKRDYPLVQGCVLLISLAYVGVNFITELAYVWVDPRIRREAA